MASIRDVAKHCGVTPMTVSLALNKPDKISATTRERVLCSIRELGYRPRAVGRKPSRDQVVTLGVLNQPYLTVPGYMMAVLQGIVARTHQREHNLLLLPAYHWHSDPSYHFRVNCDGRCDGIIFFSVPDCQHLVTVVQERGMPYVVVGDQMLDDSVSSVDVDNFQEARRATEYLLELGHRRIAFIGCLDSIESSRLRLAGFSAAMHERGLDVPSRFVHSNVDLYQDCVIIVAALLSEPRETRPTAIFAWNDQFAQQILETAKRSGIRVPEDLSVLGFDDSHVTHGRPQLTTVRQPYLDIGARAVDVLLGLIWGGEIEKVTLPAELVIRRSTAPPMD